MRPGLVSPVATELLGDGDEIRERVGLCRQAAGVVPRLALLAAAPDMGNGVDESAIHQRQPLDAELRIFRVAVGAVAVEPGWRRPVERGVPAVEDRDGNLLAVRCGRENTAGDVERGIVAARHVVDLAQRALARLHVVVEHLARLHHGLIGVSQSVRTLLEPGHKLHLGRRLAEVDGMLGAVRPAPHEDALAAPLAVALAPDEVIAIGDHVLDHAAGAMGHDLAQRRAWRLRHQLLDNLPICGAVRVGEDDQTLADVGRRILLATPAFGDRLQRPGGRVEIQNPDVAGREVAALEQQEPIGKGHPQRDGEALLALLEDQMVLGGRRAEPMAEHFLSPLHRVSPNVEQPMAVARPDGGAAHLGDFVGEVAPGGEIANPQHVALRAVLVDRVGQQLVVGADDDLGNREVAASACQGVLVEQDLLRPAAARLTAMHPALRAIGIACVVLPRPPPLRDRPVALAETSPHLRHQAALERTIGRKHGAGVGALGVEMGADRVLQNLRLLEDILGLRGLEPGVVVGMGDAVDLGRHRDAFGDRRLR